MERLFQFVLIPVAHAQIYWPDQKDTGLQSGTGTLADVKTFIGALLTRFVEFSGFAATAVLIYAGYILISKMGDPAAITKGKTYATYAIVGFLVVLLASGAVTVILQLPFFSADSSAKVPLPTDTSATTKSSSSFTSASSQTPPSSLQ